MIITQNKIKLVMRDKEAYNIGEGVYFRKLDDKQVRIQVNFDPPIKYFLVADGTKTEISKSDIERDYERFCL